MSPIVSASKEFFARVAKAAAPLLPGLGARPQEKSVEAIAGGAAGAPRTGAASGAGAAVAEAISTHQVRRLVASPPLVLEQGAAGAGWRCRGDTRVTVVYADGTEQSFACSSGASIRVLGGMIHFPPGS